MFAGIPIVTPGEVARGLRRRIISSGEFPFGLRRQALSPPACIGIRFVPTQAADRLMRMHGPHSKGAHIAISRAVFVPIFGHLYLFSLPPRPTFFRPKFLTPI